ncbi:MAG: hypothetical protein WC352_06445 [Candidatus Omnitrophota bacterium]|jgi:hypothetical protein
MRYDKEPHFEQYLNQLVRLLQKMMKNLPGQDAKPGPVEPPKGKEPNLNVFLFNFMPMMQLTPEELEEIEEMMDGPLGAEEEVLELDGELNSADKDFLRRHGIRF